MTLHRADVSVSGAATLPAEVVAAPGGSAAVRVRHAALQWGAAPLLILLDLAAIVLAGLYSGEEPAAVGLRMVAGVTCLAILGLYRPRLTVSLLEDLPTLALAGVLTGLTIPAFYRWLPSMGLQERPVVDAVVLLLLVLTARATGYFIVRRARLVGRFRDRVLVLGAGEVGIRLARTLKEHRTYGLDPVGFVDSAPLSQFVDQLPVPVVGTADQLSTCIRRHRVRRVIVAFGGHREAELVEILRTCDRLRCEIFFVPRLFEMHNTTRDVDLVRGIPLVRIRRPAYRTFAWRFKRATDVVLAGGALLLLSPLLALIAAAVRLEQGRDVLFRQTRVGLDGRSFDILKFRTLRLASGHDSDTTWNANAHIKVGPTGRILRRTSLDELPQLWNILVGDMSLVGPRPERPHFVDEFTTDIPRYSARHRVPAGLTGWAQVNDLRGDTSIEDRARFDNYYVENWSLWLDLKIILRTVGQVLRAGGS